MSVSQPTIAELRAELKKATLPTLLMEGKTDLKVFRSIKKRIGSMEFALQPCGSKNAVVELYRERASFPNGIVAFFVDRDFWVVEGVPEEYSDLALTKGYNIETELFVDGKLVLDELLYPDERVQIEKILQRVSEWVSHEYRLQESGLGGEFAKHSILSPQVMPKDSCEFTPEFLKSRGYIGHDGEMLAKISAENHSGLSGKIIFDIFHKVFDWRLDPEIKYSIKHMHDMCIARSTNMNGRIQALLAAILSQYQG